MSHNNSTTRRISIALSLCVGVFLLLSVSWAVATAEDSQEAPSETRLVRLEPGDNFIGWIAEGVSIEDLFESIPQVVALWHWDAETQTYELAAPVLPKQLWSIGRIEPGMGVFVRVGGEDVVEWHQPITPARGLVELRTGENWVAWAGPDDWSITEAAKGIGLSLEHIEFRGQIYDAAHPETAMTVAPLRRGDPLKVSMDRDTNWLQPTYLVPRIDFPGGTSSKLREHAQKDVAAILDYYAQTFSVQADASRLTVLIPKDVESLIQYHRTADPYFSKTAEESVRAQYSRASGWAGDIGGEPVIVAKRGSDCIDCSNIILLSHEYFHVLQGDLIGSRFPGGRAGDPSWLTEGAATWAGWLLHDERSNEHRADFIGLAARGPSLFSSAVLNGFSYTLGRFATELLVNRAGAAAPLEFYRQLASTRTGPSLRWYSALGWKDAFAVAFGVSVEEFYSEFDTWQQGLPDRLDHRSDPRMTELTGRVTREGKYILSGVTVTLVNSEAASQGFAAEVFSSDVTDTNGNFRLSVPKGRKVKVRVSLSDSWPCISLWHTEPGIAFESNEALAIDVDASATEKLKIVIPDGVCEHEVSGHLVGPQGVSVHGIRVFVNNSLDGRTSTIRTERDGSFRTLVPHSGEYQVGAILRDDCRVWYGPGGETVVSIDERVAIAVSDESVPDLRLVLPAGYCLVTISGRLLDSAGNGIGGGIVFVSGDDGIASGQSEADGTFSFTLPSSGSYRLGVNLDGCRAWWQRDAAPGSRQDATLFQGTGSDVTSIRFQLDRGQCDSRFTGRLLNSEGHGIVNAWVYAQADDGQGTGSRTSADGSFDISLLSGGSYRLGVNIRGCAVYYRGGGATSSWSEAEQIDTDGDVGELSIRIPANLCNATISGRLINADRHGLAHRQIGVISEGARSVHSELWTEATGYWTMRVHQNQSYRIYTYVDGCPLHYREGGATAKAQDASQIQVRESDVTGVEFRLPEDPASFCN